MNIAFDIDDVLCDLVGDFLIFYNKKFDTYFKYNNFYSYAWYDVLEHNKNDFKLVIDEYLDNGGYLKLTPYNDMINLLKDLSIDNDIYLITARPDIYDKDTKKWLDKFLGNSYKRLIYSNNNHSYKNNNLTKAEICKKLDIKFIVEDAIDYAINCVKLGIRVFLVDRPWNQDIKEYKDLIRVKNADEIRSKIYKELIL